MNKKSSILIIGLSLILVLALFGCAKSTTVAPPTTAAPAPAAVSSAAPAPVQTTSAAPAPTTSAAPAPTSSAAPASTTAAADNKVYNLILSDHNPEMAAPAVGHIAWSKYIEEKSGGRIKIKTYLGGALLGENEVYRGVQTGVADIGVYVLNQQQGFKLNTIMQLPFMGWPERQKAGAIYEQMLAEIPELKAEWQGVKVIGPCLMPGTGIHTVKKPVNTLADLKGMSIATTGEMSQLITYLGASPNEIPITDWTSSLQKGLIQGCHNHMPVLMIFGMMEFLHYHTMFGVSGINWSPVMLVMNQDKYNSLPADLQKLIDESGPIYQQAFYAADQATYDQAVAQANSMKHTFINLTTDQIAPFQAAAKPIQDAWVKDNGASGSAIYNEALKLSAAAQ